MDSKIKIAINNGWFLNISFSNFIDIIDMLLPRKTFINIEVICSGDKFNWKIRNKWKYISLVISMKEIWKKIKSKYYFELYEDNKETISY